MNKSEIIEAVRSGVPGIHIQGKDLIRIDEEIGEIANQLEFTIQEWNSGYGWVDFKTKRVLQFEQDVSLFEDLKVVANNDPRKKLYVIKNAFTALNNDHRAVARLQQELLRMSRCFSEKTAIFLVSKESVVFPEVIDLLSSFQCSPLASDQVEDVFSSLIKESSTTVNTDVRNALVTIFSGMERDMVFRIFKILSGRYQKSFTKESVKDALVLKKKVLSQSGFLELIESESNIDEIGGLDNLKAWLRNKKYIIDNLSQAKKSGITAPKGILLAGMPGCGKSMSAKAAASLFKTPLFRLDIGSLMGKFVGESEANMKAALNIAEQASPCVLWIDELEKAFAGVNGSGGSTEITTRLFGYFLTWMQEKTGAVFVIATANDITSLPSELLRRGRFDEVFYVGLPSKVEREQIFTVKTKNLKVSGSLDISELANISDGFSGADIECVINDSLEDIFRSKNSSLDQAILKKYLRIITPITVVLKDKIARYDELFKEFSLKSASLSSESISTKQKFTKKEVAASSSLTSSAVFKELILDSSSKVRMLALRNSELPSKALNVILFSFLKNNLGDSKRVNISIFDDSFIYTLSGLDKYQYLWGQGNTNSDSEEVTEEEFHLALNHENTGGWLIVNLYKEAYITSDQAFSLTHKMSVSESLKIM